MQLTRSKCTTTGLFDGPTRGFSKDITNTMRACAPIPTFSSSLPKPNSEKYLDNTTQASSQAELTMYHHQVMGLPLKLTFLAGIHKHPELFITFTGLTYD
jgi:hypothetical protein